MEFSLDGDTLPSQARSVRGESRRLRRERDNAKTLLFRSETFDSLPALAVARRNYTVVEMQLIFLADRR